ncbi:MAG: hypothetical protein PHT07_01655 [Paludibacter sp.]|nr:hypothetical protein [Paludibacter sp.]
MKVISSREFRDSQKKYLDLATTERIIIRRKNEFLEIVPRGTSIPDNPSPSNDPYFDNPQNIAQIEIAIQEVKEGKVSPLTKDNQKELLGV